MKNESGFLAYELTDIDPIGLNLAGDLFDLSGQHLLLEVLEQLGGSEADHELGAMRNEGEKLFCFRCREGGGGLNEEPVKVVQTEFCRGDLDRAL
jgi:hypothetical protein